jgi:hypothetical protein
MMDFLRFKVRPAALVSCVLVAPVHAQWQGATGSAGASLGAVVGSEMERYVRALSVSGAIRSVPWVARPFGADEMRNFLQDTSTRQHPWQRRIKEELSGRATLGVAALTTGNSGFAWGSNDGALWQGRGVTGALGLAATLRWGPLTAVAAPVLFSAQNADFDLIPIAGNSPYRDSQFPTAVDRPQRMGSGAYARVDPGESSIRLRLGRGAIGISSASLGWGAGETFPAIFGPNAGGFSHLFVGTTGRGVPIRFVGRVTTRYVVGVLEQSQWSPVEGSETYVSDSEVGSRRVGSGLTVSLMPAALPGLEIGASRFYHTPFTAPETRWNSWSKPIEGLFKTSRADAASAGDTGNLIDNQLASFFARWALASRGIEASVEVLREDHNYDARDLAQEPENNGALFGAVRAVVERSARRLSLLTLEYFNGDVSPIGQVRSQGSLYAHLPLRQGHTQRGQLLGSPVGVGAVAGSRAAFERFDATGSTRVSLQRWRTRSQRSSDPEQLYRPARYPVPNSHDWVLDASLGLTRFRGGDNISADLGIAWAGMWQFGDSRTNLYARFGWARF